MLKNIQIFNLGQSTKGKCGSKRELSEILKRFDLVIEERIIFGTSVESSRTKEHPRSSEDCFGFYVLIFNFKF